MEENPYTAPAADSPERPIKTIGTIPALIGVYVLVQVFALVVSPAGDPYSMLLLQVPCIVFGLACFALGRLSRTSENKNPMTPLNRTPEISTLRGRRATIAVCAPRRGCQANRGHAGSAGVRFNRSPNSYRNRSCCATP